MPRARVNRIAGARLFTPAFIISSVPCIAMTVLCLASIWKPIRWADTRDFYSFHQGGPDYQKHRCVTLAWGVLHVQAVQMRAPEARWSIKAVIAGYPLGFPFVKNYLGFSIQLSPPGGWSTGGGSYREASFPVWLLAGLAALLLRRPFHVWRQRRSIDRGCCPTCHYDLTGNVSGVCPECGGACNTPSMMGQSPAEVD